MRNFVNGILRWLQQLTTAYLQVKSVLETELKQNCSVKQVGNISKVRRNEKTIPNLWMNEFMNEKK